MRECDDGVDEDVHSHAAYRWSCSITSSHLHRTHVTHTAAVESDITARVRGMSINVLLYLI